jgi:hypothetical protein
MESLQAGDLTINVVSVDDPPTIQLHWLGMSNERQPEKILGPYFASMLDAATVQQRTLELHFEKIERFNSSTIMAIIQLIQEARHRGVRLAMMYDPGRKWQRLSFDALRIFDKNDGQFVLAPVGAV